MNQKKLQRIDNGSPGVSEFLHQSSCATKAEDPRPASLHNLQRPACSGHTGADAPVCFAASHHCNPPSRVAAGKWGS
jgi:hypothetical protein